MRVPISEVGRHGRLDLTFGARHGRTTLCDTYFEVPFKITCLHESGFLGIPHLILMQCTPGLFGGDKLECVIRVEGGARVLVTQQAATKVHPSTAEPAIQHVQISVDSGGELHLYYEPIIPFSGSRLHQVTSIDLEAGARLCFWESFMAGRVGRGEVWEFKELASETCLRLNGQRLYLDRFRLAPGEHLPTGPWEMADFRYFGTGLYFGRDAAEFGDRLHELLPGVAPVALDTPAPDLTIVRTLAAEGQTFHRYREIFETTALALTRTSRN